MTYCFKFTRIHRTLLRAVIALSLLPSASAVEDDGGFHSMAEHLAADPMKAKFFFPQENIDELFDATGMTRRLTLTTHVRLCRKPSNAEGDFYRVFEGKAPLRELLGAQLPTVEVQAKDVSPWFKQVLDFSNYGDTTICGFDPGVAVLIGDDEPAFVLVCCFKCHDIHVIRRPTSEHPLPRVTQAGMSPELERALFALTKSSYPADASLQKFKLPEQFRSKTPLPKQDPSNIPPDPFADPLADPRGIPEKK